MDVETELVVPSPKLHKYDVMEPVDLLVNVTLKGAVPEVTLVVKLATGAAGGGFTVMVIVMPSVPPWPITVKVAVYVPAPRSRYVQAD